MEIKWSLFVKKAFRIPHRIVEILIAEIYKIINVRSRLPNTSSILSSYLLLCKELWIVIMVNISHLLSQNKFLFLGIESFLTYPSAITKIGTIYQKTERGILNDTSDFL